MDEPFAHNLGSLANAYEEPRTEWLFLFFVECIRAEMEVDVTLLGSIQSSTTTLPHLKEKGDY